MVNPLRLEKWENGIDGIDWHVHVAEEESIEDSAVNDPAWAWFLKVLDRGGQKSHAYWADFMEEVCVVGVHQVGSIESDGVLNDENSITKQQSQIR